MRRISTSVQFAIFFLAIMARTQGQAEMPKPGAEQKKLDYFVGTWNLEGEMKPSPMGPGGKFTNTVTNKWMQGGFFVVGQSNFKSAMGDASELSLMGYSSEDRMYTFDGFDSSGGRESGKGTMDGDSWSFNMDEHMGDQTVKGHYAIKIVSPTSYTFKFEMSPDGHSWNTVMEGKATKK
jgi:hypothetical protein